MEIRDVCTGRRYTDKTTKEEKTQWYRIGAAFIHSDGRMNLELAALPVNGDCVLFPRKPKESGSKEEPLPF